MISDFIGAEPIGGGYSDAEKYKAAAPGGVACMVKISDVGTWERRSRIFELMCDLLAAGAPVSRPIEIGRCERGVYTVCEWLDGCEAESRIAGFTPERQYLFGRQAGKALRAIHSVRLNARENKIDWRERCERIRAERLAELERSGVTYPGLGRLNDYLEARRGLIDRRPTALLHNDYHLGNMLISGDRLYVVDFDECGCGDPISDFAGLLHSALNYPNFAVGQLHGYFDGEPDADFWPLFAYYTALQFPAYIAWAGGLGAEEIEHRCRAADRFLDESEQTSLPIPRWYYKSE